MFVSAGVLLLLPAVSLPPAPSSKSNQLIAQPWPWAARSKSHEHPSTSILNTLSIIYWSMLNFLIRKVIPTPAMWDQLTKKWLQWRYIKHLAIKSTLWFSVSCGRLLCFGLTMMWTGPTGSDFLQQRTGLSQRETMHSSKPLYCRVAVRNRSNWLNDCSIHEAVRKLHSPLPSRCCHMLCTNCILWIIAFVHNRWYALTESVHTRRWR